MSDFNTFYDDISRINMPYQPIIVHDPYITQPKKQSMIQIPHEEIKYNIQYTNLLSTTNQLKTLLYVFIWIVILLVGFSGFILYTLYNKNTLLENQLANINTFYGNISLFGDLNLNGSLYFSDPYLITATSQGLMFYNFNPVTLVKTLLLSLDSNGIILIPSLNVTSGSNLNTVNIAGLADTNGIVDTNSISTPILVASKQIDTINLLATNSTILDGITAINGNLTINGVTYSPGIVGSQGPPGINGINGTQGPQGIPGIGGGNPIYPVNSEMVFVNAGGSDSTGNGTIQAPFATIGKAVSVILDSSSVKPYSVLISSGSYIENGLKIPPWTFLVGQGAQQSVKVFDSTFLIGLQNTATWASGSQRVGISHIHIASQGTPTGISFNFQQFGGTGSNQYYMNDIQIDGPFSFLGRSSSSDTGTVFNCRFFGTVTNSGSTEEFFSGYFANSVTFNNNGLTGKSAAPSFVGFQFFSGATFTSTGSGNTLNPILVASQVSGTLIIDQTQSILAADSASVSSATISLTNGGTIQYLTNAASIAYTAASSTNWNNHFGSTPLVLNAALDLIATKPTVTSGIAVLNSTGMITVYNILANVNSIIQLTPQFGPVPIGLPYIEYLATGYFTIASKAGASDVNVNMGWTLTSSV